MAERSSQQAAQALDALTAQEVQQVLGILVANSPGAVLDAVGVWLRHHAVLAQLLGRREDESPAADPAEGYRPRTEYGVARERRAELLAQLPGQLRIDD